MQKLIAYDHLEGDPGLEGGKNVPLFTDILNMICSCVDNSSPDRYASFHIGCSFYFTNYVFCYACYLSTILQVLKVLLTSVASTKFRGTLQI